MNFIRLILSSTWISLIVLLSIPAALISFLWTTQTNAWRFGRDFFRRYVQHREDIFS